MKRTVEVLVCDWCLPRRERTAVESVQLTFPITGIKPSHLDLCNQHLKKLILDHGSEVQSDPDEPGYVTTKEAAAILGVAPPRITGLVKEGKLQEASFAKRNTYYYERAAVESLARERGM